MGTRYFHVAFVPLVAFALSSCGWFRFEQRPAWRGQAEAACMKSGAVRESASVRMRKSLDGPGICGADLPLVVSALGGEGSALTSFAPEVRPYAPVLGPYTPIQITPQNANPVAQPHVVVDMPTVIAPEVTLNCPMTAAMQSWIRDVVQPAALLRFGQPIAQIDSVGGYSCRRINNASRGALSEHAFANAIDIRGFTLADGRKLVISQSAKADDERADFLIDVQTGACGFFSTVLAPGANALHYDHIHLDLARRSSGRSVCSFVDYRSQERKIFARNQTLTTGTVPRLVQVVPKPAAAFALEELVGD